ncbi:MAG: Uma2 family endonuclease, partial [Candidatus Promineofilum sp.]|nr:Uma2 family endonuclease [Promineifilum sp.]
IQEVWIVNLVEGQIEVYRGPVSGEYQSAETFVSGDQISPQAFGDAAFAVDDILS